MSALTSITLAVFSDLSIARAIPAVALIGALAVGCSGTDGSFDGEEFEGDDAASSSAAVSGGSTWKPPSSPADGTYTGGGPYNGGKGCTGGMLPGTKALKARVEKEFSVKVEGYACRPNTAATSQLSMHGTGRALDIMVTGSRGTTIADWLVKNHNSLGIQFVIWSRAKWNAANGPGSYGGPNPHTDHIHAELTKTAASSASTGNAPADDPNDDLPTPGGDQPPPPPPPTGSSGGTTGGGMLGTACGSSGQCNPGNDGSGLMCSQGRCIVGCTSDIYCPGNDRCIANRCQ